MKKKVTVIILALFAAVVFFAGWIQFAIPAGKYGVLVSKTGGVDSNPIVPAKFRWQWERLIPTNATILVFDLAPKTFVVSSSGTLPSGDLYGKMLEGDPDFSWKMDIRLTGRVMPEKLPFLVRSLSIKKQEELDSWTDAKLKSAAENAGAKLVANLLDDPSAAALASGKPDELGTLLAAKMTEAAADELEIVECTPSFVRIPDLSLYTLAASTYAEYQKTRSTLFARTAAAEADASVSEYLQIERFGRWGELLTKYPILIDFLAVSKDDAGEAFKAVRSLK